MRVQDLLLDALHAKRENRLEDARRDLRDAAAQLREKNVPSELADVLRDLGELERRLRNADAARGHYEEAVAILSGVDDPLRLAHTMRHLGDVHYEAERTTAAELSLPRSDRALPERGPHQTPRSRERDPEHGGVEERLRARRGSARALAGGEGALCRGERAARRGGVHGEAADPDRARIGVGQALLR